MENVINRKHAFLFQGVGTDYRRKLHLLDDEQREMLNEYCLLIKTEIGLDLWNYLFNNVVSVHDKMFSDWIAIYTIDCIVFNTYINSKIEPELFLGYSMGLITAMVCGKSISFESGLHMLLKIYEYPRYTSRIEEAMAVIVGMNNDDVSNIISSNNLEEYVGIASENNKYCIVISGNRHCVEKVMSIAKMEGALKVKLINSPYAFHFKLAEIGIERYVRYVEKLKVSDCMVPIISSFNQGIIQNYYDLKNELIKNMTSRMYWDKSIEKIANMGINSFIEVSIEDSITKFSKLVNSSCEFFTYNKFIKFKLNKDRLIVNSEDEKPEKVG